MTCKWVMDYLLLIEHTHPISLLTGDAAVCVQPEASQLGDEPTTLETQTTTQNVHKAALR